MSTTHRCSLSRDFKCFCLVVVTGANQTRSIDITLKENYFEDTFLLIHILKDCYHCWYLWPMWYSIRESGFVLRESTDKHIVNCFVFVAVSFILLFVLFGIYLFFCTSRLVYCISVRFILCFIHYFLYWLVFSFTAYPTSAHILYGFDWMKMV